MRGASDIQYPGVLGAAALARIDHQRALLQRYASQPAGHDADIVAAGENERPEIDMPRRQPRLGGCRAGRQRQRRLGDEALGGMDELGAEGLEPG